MPLQSGSSKKTISHNIAEFHKGPTFEHTADKFGEKDADRQAIAVAFSEAHKTSKSKHLEGLNKKRFNKH